MGFFNGLRRGRDDAIETRREACRVHGQRYDGCPLDIIEVHQALVVTEIEPPSPAATSQTTDRKSIRTPLMGFIDGLRRGRDAAIASSAPSAVPPRNGGPGGDDEPPETQCAPSPIKIGYYYNRESNRPSARRSVGYERHVLMFGLNGAGKSTRFLIELLATACYRSLFVFDIKGELAYQTAEMRRRYSRCEDHQSASACSACRAMDSIRSSVLDPESPKFYDAAAAIGDALIEIESGSGQYWSESGARSARRPHHVRGDRGAARNARSPSLVQRPAAC